MRWITPTDNKYNSIGNFFMRCDTINSTSKSNRMAANGWDFDNRSYLIETKIRKRLNISIWWWRFFFQRSNGFCAHNRRHIIGIVCVWTWLTCGSLRCRIGARCNSTLYVRLLSCIIELAYWSSEMHVKMRKHNFKLAALDSFLLSCITIEL